MALTYLILGSNSDDKETILPRAIALLASKLGAIKKTSSIFETEAWGYESQNTYHNQVIVCETTFPANDTLNITQKIEIELGRKNKSVNGVYTDRPIDIDILYYDKEIINTPTLQIPHQHLQDRQFVLIPLVEIAPDFTHPIFSKTNQELLSECTDIGKVKKL